MFLYSLYDSKADGFTPPFVAKNDDLACRTVIDTYRHVGECQLTQYPEDFTLFRIGSWDVDTGTIEGFEAKRSCGTVLQIVTAKIKEKEAE